MRPVAFDVIQPDLETVETLGRENGYERQRIRTLRGVVETRLYDAPAARTAVLCVGGVGGGFDSPAQGLYERLGEELSAGGTKLLRVRFRESTHLAEATHDVLAGVALLRADGVERVALVGHSFGGAVVIAAAVAAPAVAAVICLATQSYGADCVNLLAPRPLLLIHGRADEVLPPSSSLHIAALAGEPHELVLIDGAGHLLDEAAEQVFRLVKDWLERNLTADH